MIPLRNAHSSSKSDVEHDSVWMRIILGNVLRWKVYMPALDAGTQNHIEDGVRRMRSRWEGPTVKVKIILPQIPYFDPNSRKL